jgi:hypothetical protein
MATTTSDTARVPEDVSRRLRRVPVGSVPWRHTFRALRHRDYRLFFWGQLVSLTGTWMRLRSFRAGDAVRDSKAQSDKLEIIVSDLPGFRHVVAGITGS